MSVFCFFVGMGCVESSSSHVLVVGVFGFLVWAVFLFALGWGKRLFCPWAMLDGMGLDGD